MVEGYLGLVNWINNFMDGLLKCKKIFNELKRKNVKFKDKWNKYYEKIFCVK